MEYRGQGASEANDGDPREASIGYCGSVICFVGTCFYLEEKVFDLYVSLFQKIIRFFLENLDIPCYTLNMEKRKRIQINKIKETLK